ncbi:MAG: hypothetical protein V7L23_01690 [Nostoc sp.]|uniref:hypothetical protein n=1 Tax=Nostoc sp. TaxID=1180 RepID=UPI002FF284BA
MIIVCTLRQQGSRVQGARERIYRFCLIMLVMQFVGATAYQPPKELLIPLDFGRGFYHSAKVLST